MQLRLKTDPAKFDRKSVEALPLRRPFDPPADPAAEAEAHGVGGRARGRVVNVCVCVLAHVPCCMAKGCVHEVWRAATVH